MDLTRLRALVKYKRRVKIICLFKFKDTFFNLYSYTRRVRPRLCRGKDFRGSIVEL